MVATEAIGCLLVAFSPTLAIFVIVIARDPLRIVLFILGAFFYLLSLLLSSVVWLIPFGRASMYVGLGFSMIFQEAIRVAYYLLIKKAQKGLETMGEINLEIAGVHALKDARHLMATVCGLGFGFMSGLMSIGNVIADRFGPGTLGFPKYVHSNDSSLLAIDPGTGDYRFALISSLTVSCLVMLHVAWTVISWNSIHEWETNVKFWWLGAALVPVTHIVFTLASLFNLLQSDLNYKISLPIQYGLMVICLLLAYRITGGNLTRLKLALTTEKSNEEDIQMRTNQATPVLHEIPDRQEDEAGPSGSGENPSQPDPDENLRQRTPVE